MINFGIIGQLKNISQNIVYVQFQETMICINRQFLGNSILDGGIGIIGCNNGLNIKMKHTILNQSNIQCYQYSGGLIGLTQLSSIINLENIEVQNSNISSSTRAAGFVAYSKNTNYVIQNSKIVSINIKSSAAFGIAFGYNAGGNVLNINNSQSQGDNYINDVLRQNCQNFSNIWSVLQCN
ncbi:Hypothetical_protein [Hexamita inflata]|uniref:Hypothetical_protein n=1 Tax=Hexamita inflata TaxID=28002 RepID=A0ABP1GVU6_9EUKA